MRNLKQFFAQKQIIIMLAAAILFFAGAFGVVFAIYSSQVKLQSAALNKFQREAEVFVDSIAFLEEERRISVDEIAKGPSVSGYFKNKALGMTMLYGLSASLYQVGAEFQTAIEQGKKRKRIMYSRLVFVDQTGNLLVDVTEDYARISWEATLMAEYDELTGILNNKVETYFNLQYKNGLHEPIVAAACTFNGEYVGSIVAWLNPQVLFQARNISRYSTNARLLVYDGTNISTLDTSAESEYPAFLKAIEKNPIAEVFKVKTPADNLLAIRLNIGATDFSLVYAVPALTVLPTLGPNVILAMLIFIAVIVIMAIIFAIRFYLRTMLLEINLVEESERKLVIEQKNNQLEREINERIQAEKKIRESEIEIQTILHSVQAGVVVIDPERLIIINANPAAIDMIGGIRANLINASCKGVLCSQYKECAVAKQGVLSCLDDSLVWRHDGTEMPVLKNAVRTKLLGRDIIVVSFVDISQLQKVEQEKTEMQQKMYQASKLASIGELAAGVGHEINNPLAIIAGNLELARDCVADFENVVPAILFEAFNKQEIAIKRIANIVNGLRVFARQDSNYDVIDIHVVIKDCIFLIEKIYEQDGVYFELTLNAEVSKILGNAGHFQQVLLNLFSNAKDAMARNKGGAIKVVTNNNRHDEVQVQVIDEGCGIKPEHIERIFDTFFTTKDVGKGTGLGLGISYSIVKNMHGEFKVQSVVGQGTTMMIIFPAVVLGNALAKAS